VPPELQTMKILAADLWPIGAADENWHVAAERERVASQMRLQQLVENILLYDQVVLPTDNFLSIRILADSFGAEGLSQLIDEGIVRFIRAKGMLVYVGEGHGISFIDSVQPGTSGRPLGPMWVPTGVAAYAILREIPGVTDRRARQIAQGIISATKEIELSHLRDELREGTLAAATSPTMDDSLRITSPDIQNLPGKNANQIILPSSFRKPLEPDNDIGRLLRIARTQLEILTQQQAGCDDISTLSPIGKVLSATPGGSLRHLYEITDVPDVGTAVIKGTVSLEKVIELRNSRHWQQFAQWFHAECGADPTRVGKEYIKLLKEPGVLDSTFFKTVRLLLPTFLGFVSPEAGIALAAADMYLTPTIKGPSAKYFIERLEQITETQSAGMA
jgi:hypothetical protein